MRSLLILLLPGLEARLTSLQLGSRGVYSTNPFLPPSLLRLPPKLWPIFQEYPLPHHVGITMHSVVSSQTVNQELPSYVNFPD